VCSSDGRTLAEDDSSLEECGTAECEPNARAFSRSHFSSLLEKCLREERRGEHK